MRHSCSGSPACGPPTEWGLGRSAKEFWATYPDLGDAIQDFPGPAHDFWGGLNEGGRSDLRDFAVWHGLKQMGPGVFLFGEVQRHLDRLYRSMNHSPEMAVRKAARGRFARICRLPDLRRFKGESKIGIDPVAVAEAVDDVLARVARIRKKGLKTIKQVEQALKAEFSEWTEKSIRRVAPFILSTDAYGRRNAIYAAVGASFPHATVGHVHEHVAVGRQIKRMRELVVRLETQRGTRRDPGSDA